jgi:hypothetical protein
MRKIEGSRVWLSGAKVRRSKSKEARDARVLSLDVKQANVIK